MIRHNHRFKTILILKFNRAIPTIKTDREREREREKDGSGSKSGHTLSEDPKVDPLEGTLRDSGTLMMRMCKNWVGRIVDGSNLSG